MKRLPADYYDKYRHARRAYAFYRGALASYEPSSRYIDFWVVSYYLLSHSIELTIKAVVYQRTGRNVTGHNKVELSERFKEECGFSEEEMKTIIALSKLNNGPGGLRYENRIIGDFYPLVFSEGVSIVERLFEENFQK